MPGSPVALRRRTDNDENEQELPVESKNTLSEHFFRLVTDPGRFVALIHSERAMFAPP